MSPEASSRKHPSTSPRTLERMLPPGPPAPVAELVRSMGLWDRPGAQRGRPHVLLNMVSTVDGRATLGGTSGAIGGAGDRELFHGLRAAADGVLVGAGTVRAERYGPIIRDPAVRAERLARGLPEEPLACIVSGRLELPQDIGLLQSDTARVVVATPSQASLPPLPAQVEYLRCTDDGGLDLAAVMGELRLRFGVRSLLCEGGPHLARQLLVEQLLDELFLSLSPDCSGESRSVGRRYGSWREPSWSPRRSSS